MGVEHRPGDHGDGENQEGGEGAGNGESERGRAGKEVRVKEAKEGAVAHDEAPGRRMSVGMI